MLLIQRVIDTYDEDDNKNGFLVEVETIEPKQQEEEDTVPAQLDVLEESLFSDNDEPAAMSLARRPRIHFNQW